MKMMEVYYRVMKHKPDGKLVKDTGLIPSHSFVVQFLEFFQSLCKAANVTATDVTGAESVLNDVSDDISTKSQYRAGVGNDTFGIVVGTNAGTTAVDNENYALDTKIVTGSGANQLSYQAVTIVAPRTVGANIDMDLTRAFVNESGGTITVKEIGIIIKNTTDTKYHLILRDVVTDEDVEDGYTLTVVYTLRTTA